ncbi:MAG: VCBS repeat-containing protein, partial [Oceanococcaceae bacterium]
EVVSTSVTTVQMDAGGTSLPRATVNLHRVGGIVASSGTFEAVTNFGVGDSPRSVTPGDFNGDGDLDLAVANFVIGGTGSVSILLGDGSGGFSSPMGSPFDAGTGLTASAAGDFDGDGVLDLAVTDFDSDNVAILLGDGDGSFGAATDFMVGALPFSVTAGDFDGDGDLDLAVASNDGVVSILLGAGDGSFVAAPNVAADGGPRTVITGDFNGDGVLDLAVANIGSNSVSILLGDGSGGFADAAGSPVLFDGEDPDDPFDLGPAPFSVTTGDFDGDGDLDLAVASFRANNVSILLGDGSGGFEEAIGSPIMVGATPVSVTTGDLNGDGNLDLAVANNSSGSNSVSILLGDGSGGFGAATNYGVGDNPNSVSIGDLNGDGVLDLATANSSSDNVSIRLGTVPPP